MRKYKEITHGSIDYVGYEYANQDEAYAHKQIMENDGFYTAKCYFNGLIYVGDYEKWIELLGDTP